MSIVDWFYPRYCAGCGSPGVSICDTCSAALAMPPPICPVCHSQSLDGWVHARCVRPQGIDRLIVGLPYSGVVQSILKDVKYKSAWDPIQDLFLAWSMHVHISVVPDTFLISSVPMYLQKERERGFNQAEYFARLIARSHSVPYTPLLTRVRATIPMYGLDKNERKANVSGAFSFTRNRSVLTGKTVILADDLWTTGATLRECTKVIKRHGASHVWTVTLAR